MRVAILCLALTANAQDITSLFPKIDANTDGFLDREEVLTFLKSGHVLTTAEEKRDIIEEVKEKLTSEFMDKDLNQDGFLTVEERGTAEVNIDKYLLLKSDDVAGLAADREGEAPSSPCRQRTGQCRR